MRGRRDLRRARGFVGHFRPKRAKDSFRPMPEQGSIFAAAHDDRRETIRIGINDRDSEALEDDHVCAIEVRWEFGLDEIPR